MLAEFGELSDWLTLTEQSASPYLDFLRQLGDNPFIACVMFAFQQQRIAGTLQSVPNEVDLHLLTIAWTRRFLDGSVGDTLPITKKAAAGRYATVVEFAQEVNPERAGVLDGPPDSTWLRNALESIKNIQGARHVFNATQLPVVRATCAAAFGSPFTLIPFGVGQNRWQMDHLIPQNSFPSDKSPALASSPGDPYQTTLRNLCPIRGTDNAAYKATACADKLDTNSSKLVTYSEDDQKAVGGRPVIVIEELLKQQGKAGGNVALNERQWLAAKNPADDRCYGQERIELLASLLLARL